MGKHYTGPCWTVDGMDGAECGRANVPTTQDRMEVRCQDCISHMPDGFPKPNGGPQMGKHTPGPWRTCAANSGDCPCRLVYAGELCIAGWYGGDDFVCDGVGQTPDVATGKANARLITAAPELYEHLSMLVNGVMHSKVTREELVMLATNARAALAKAQARTGGERGEG